jgi:hypothetical protein
MVWVEPPTPSIAPAEHTALNSCATSGNLLRVGGWERGVKQQTKGLKIPSGAKQGGAGTGLGGRGSHLVPWLGEHRIAGRSSQLASRRYTHERDGICTHTAG